MAKEAEVFGSLSFLSQLRYRHLVAGVAGGVTATLLTHPFDLIKLRLAVQDGKGTGERTSYRGPIHAFRSILREEGVRQLYRGASANVAGSGASWGLYFFFYNAMKFSLQEGDIDVSLSALHHLMCAVFAGALTLTVTNPIWVVKTRMCLVSSPSLPRHMRYRGLRDGLANLWRHEGLRGMYTGYVPGLIGTSHGAIQFMVYEELKKFYCHHYNLPLSTQLSPLHYIAMAASSKVVAVTATYPYQVIRARLQDQEQRYSGLRDTIWRTYRHEGVRGFYKGITANLAKVVPAVSITFVVYENVSAALR
ncbi:Mitochondrial folate transporter/carrier [Geodia barretti]|uniref:Solute carrier family 25 member 32 n=2 Tax=Geodia barretti TaxID=519541 RepID=A0AA35R6A1_GEOBA|nr:Mitochondrial folate transporter/carrier [Geodia barretti]